MATRGIQLAFTLNPADFIKGLKRIEVDLEDVKDALDEVADTDVELDTDKAEDGLEDVEDAADDAKKAIEDIGDAKSDLGKVETAAGDLETDLKGVKTEAEKTESAFGKLGTSAKADMGKVENAADRASDQVDEVGEEAGQSAKEFGSSFRGDPIEALEEVQSLGAELALKTIPGIGGAVAAIGGGILFGFVISQFEKLREAAEEVREKVRELRDEYIELEDVDFASIGEQSAFDRFIEQLDEVGVGLEDFQDKVDDASPKAQELYDAFKETGSAEDLLAFLDQLRTDINLTGDEYDDVSRDLLNDTGPLRDIFRDAGDEAAYARDNFSDAALGIGEAAEETKTFAEVIEDAASAVEDFGGPFADADEAVDNFRETVNDTNAAVQDLTANGAQPLADGLNVTTEAGLDAKDALRGLADDALAAASAQIELDGNTANATETVREARQAFIDQAVELGLTREEARGYADDLGLIPADVASIVTVSDEGTIDATATDIENTVPGQVDTTVDVDDDGSAGDTRDDINDVADDDYKATIDVEVSGTTTAANWINAVADASYTAKINVDATARNPLAVRLVRRGLL